jgi:hypothetical protein
MDKEKLDSLKEASKEFIGKEITVSLPTSPRTDKIFVFDRLSGEMGIAIGKEKMSYTIYGIFKSEDGEKVFPLEKVIEAFSKELPITIIY